MNTEGQLFFRTPQTGQAEVFTGGLAFGGLRVLDRTGKLVSNEAYLKSIGIDVTKFKDLEFGPKRTRMRYNDDGLA